MTVRLRPHHLLCVLTYVGKGYSPAFVANYDHIAQRIGGGEDVLIVSGPDDICAPLLGTSDAHCQRQSVSERDIKATADLGACLGIEVTQGAKMTLTPERLSRMRTAFASGKTRRACAGCDWADLCDTVTGNDFRGTRLRP